MRQWANPDEIGPPLTLHEGFQAWILCSYFGNNKYKYLNEKFSMLLSANWKDFTVLSYLLTGIQVQF